MHEPEQQSAPDTQFERMPVGTQHFPRRQTYASQHVPDVPASSPHSSPALRHTGGASFDASPSPASVLSLPPSSLPPSFPATPPVFEPPEDGEPPDVVAPPVDGDPPAPAPAAL